MTVGYVLCMAGHSHYKRHFSKNSRKKRSINWWQSLSLFAQTKCLMIHATATALNKLEPLLKRLRTLPTLKEKSRGIFYYKSKAFLHFHEDAQGLFADVSISSSWTRFSVNSVIEYQQLIEVVKAEISAKENV